MVRQHPWPKAPDQGSVQLDPGPGRPDLAADRQLHRRPSPRRRRQPDVQKLQGREERRRRNPALPPPSSPPARQPGAGSGGGRAVDARLTAAGELPSPGRHGQEKAGAAWNRLPGTPRRERRPPSWTPTGAMEGASDPAQRALDLKPERAAANQARSPRPEEEEGREGGREKRKGAMGWPPPAAAAARGARRPMGVETEVGGRPSIKEIEDLKSDLDEDLRQLGYCEENEKLRAELEARNDGLTEGNEELHASQERQ
ncbi:hypothetical protein SORBI_3003G072566 [Sorghum bicolor]|uniref:Uncharacterized protein n=1 Tax=Sorghum bicolor TaxID=4558 RepID=C5XQ02_SORBI|nr:hypothetical protein SORBI_3003G072566 [Sorghum bicolor]